MEKEQIPEKCDGCANYNVVNGYCALKYFFGNEDLCEYCSLEEEYKKNTPSNRR